MNEKIEISDVDGLETELAKINDALAHLDKLRRECDADIGGINDRLSELWGLHPELWSKSPVADKPAPAQPIRIRQDDMVMVKWNDAADAIELPLKAVAIDSPRFMRLCEYISPILPEQSGGGWKICGPESDEKVWKFSPDHGMYKLAKRFLTPGDVFHAIDPNHPDVPPMKPEGM